MTKEEKKEWKMYLFDNISEAKNSMDIIGIQQETDAIFTYCEDLSNSLIERQEYKDEKLKADLLTSISSYYLLPQLDIKNRLPFIYGLIYVGEILSLGDEGFDKMSLEEKIEIANTGIEIIAKTSIIPLDEELLVFIRLGIRMALEMDEDVKSKDNPSK